MRRAFTWLAILLFGLALGSGGAVLSLRSATFGNDIRSGPWTSGRAIGTADADIRTRAVVALRGLLALPASEARYFTAGVDSAGRALDGRCTYTIRGGPTAARWWSVTLYDRQGWLVPASGQRHSVGSAAVSLTGTGRWAVVVAPDSQTQTWIATGQPGPFELTLRAYWPSGAFAEAPSPASMPVIERIRCPR